MSGKDDYPSRIINCYNTGKIKSTSDTGGIVGRMCFGANDIIKNCYNLGIIEGRITLLQRNNNR